MSMKIEILIKGLALCFDKRDVWNIVFLCDDEHKLWFKGPNGPQKDLRVLNMDRRVVFESRGIAPLPPNAGPDFGRIFNLASPLVHKRHMLTENRRKDKTDLVTVILPSATLDTFALTPNFYYIQDLESEGLPPRIINPVANVILATFELDKAEFDLEMNEIVGSATSLIESFPYVDGSTIKLEFNNDCQGACRENDFLGLYEIVEDKDGKKFAAGQIKQSPEMGGPAELFGADGKVMMMIPDSGNCDPNVCDPAPD